MAEGLALAASIAAILQITNSVISVCHGYGAAAKDAPWELVNAEMKSLRNVLQTLQPLAEQAEFASPSAGTHLPTLALLCGPRGLLNCCLDEVRRLDERLKNPSWSDSFGPKKKAFIQALRWPLNKAETMKVLDDVSRYRNILNLAITADQTTLTLEIQKLSISTNDIVLGTQRDVCLIKDLASDMHADVQSTKSITLGIQLGMEREKIHRWLSAGSPDPSTNQIRASRSRQANTGLWFLKSETFTYWKASSALVWLHGKAGCGKTVLSSTIINAVLQEPQSKSEIGVAYFYFDFNDVEKQKSDKMIWSLITQLSRQSKKKLNKLEALFSFCNNGERQPDVEGLLIVLKEVVEGFDETYIVLDALDECSDREELLERMGEIQGWKLRQLRMLVTSRWLIDIKESLEPLTEPRGRICIQSSLVDADILTYVRGRLQNDRALKRWRGMPQVQEEIETTLKEKANGMFRWAVCQLDALQNCHRLPILRKALESLPETLDETYARILRNISEEDSHDAIKILQWLTYSSRPLRIEELAEIVAVNINGSPWFDHTARFPDQEDILAICSSLVAVEDVSIKEDDSEDDKFLLQRQYGSTLVNPIQVVRLAHFSVKEYLVSKRIRDQAAATARYAIQEIQANQSIAAACLAYLLQFNQHDSLTSQTLEDFPLARYAAQYWLQHTGEVDKDLGPIEMLSQEFWLVHREAYINWYRLHDPDKAWEGFEMNREIARIATPLYYGSLAGVTELLQLLLKKGADVNAQGGQYGSALQAASIDGHESVVQLLLKNGADVNSQGGEYGSALQAASFDGNESVVQLLLKNGADVNSQGGEYGSALQAASFDGHESVVQLLLKNGADVNAQGGSYGNALQAASWGGHESVVQLLLKKGADVTAQGGQFGNALQAASLAGHESLVQLLLKNEADVNAQGGPYGKALQAASHGGHEPVVQLLLDNGADVKTQGGHFGNALQAASEKCHESVVQLLLDNGADINAQCGQFGNALQAASLRGHESVVQLLLKKGADVTAQGGQYGIALQAASQGGHESVVQLLLKNGADVNDQGGHFGNALQAASCGGHEPVVQLLLKNGADVNDQGGHFGNALQAASCGGHESVVQLLLKNGADVKTQGGHFGNALQAASCGGHKSVVQLLLKNGADVKAQGGQFGNALQVASCGGHESVVQLLLKNGADVNAQGGVLGNALQAASREGRESVVQLLLDNGADINAQGGRFGNALQAASRGGHESVVQLLLDNGADINAQGGPYGKALQAAFRGGHESVVQLLLKNGADVNAQGGVLGNALQAASLRGHESVVQLLLKKGADVTAQGGQFGNALQAASLAGHESLVQLLLKNEADVNAQGGPYGKALQAASHGGHEPVVQLLLDNGADINAQGGQFGNALQAASRGGHEPVVQLLLKNGADVNAQGGPYGKALQAASYGGGESVVQLLLHNGADVHAKGGLYGSALQAALDVDVPSWTTKDQREAVVQLLRSAMASQPPPAPPMLRELPFRRFPC